MTESYIFILTVQLPCTYILPEIKKKSFYDNAYMLSKDLVPHNMYIHSGSASIRSYGHTAVILVFLIADN
jgi:hypothetical protein